MFFRKSSRSLALSNPKRILIVRLGGIGGVIHTLPLLVALRTRFPMAEIAWLAEDVAAPLIDGHWALDRLMIVKKDWTMSLSNIRLLRRRLGNFAPEVTIDTQSSLASSFAAWVSGASHRIGFNGVDGREGSRWLNNCRILPTAAHAVDRNLQLLEKFDLYGSSIDFDLPECEMDRRSAQEILRRQGLHGNFAALNVGAGRASKLWREERYAEVAKYLFEQWNLPSLVLWTGPEGQKMAETVIQNAEGAAVQAPQTRLTELASLIRTATLLVGSDSGPLHLAVAVGTRCVGLYGLESAERNGPYGGLNRSVLSSRPNLSGGRQFQKNRDSMDTIEVARVCEACDEILTEILPNESLPMPQRGFTERRAA